MRRWPYKLKRHIENYLRFVGVYFIVATTIEVWQENVGFEHYWLIRFCYGTLFLAISAWFVRRGYTGLCRDYDFYIED